MQIETMTTTAYLLDWLKSKTQTMPNADKDVEQRELSLLVGMQSGTATYKPKRGFTVLPRIELTSTQKPAQEGLY